MERIEERNSVEVRGRVEALGEGGRGICPERIVGWGIDTDAFRRNSLSVGVRGEGV